MGTRTRAEKVVEAVCEERGVEHADECGVEARVAPAVEAPEVCRAATLKGLVAQSKSNGWREKQVDRARVLRVLREMKWWYGRQDRVWPEVESMEQASTAEQLKSLLVARCPDSEAGLKIREGSKNDRLWDRLQLVVARVRGRREHFVTAFSADGVWELLRLRVPPIVQTEEDRVMHARRQATYQDDEHGNFVPGMRVRWERWEPYLEGEDLEWVRGMATGGAPMLFSAQPATYWRQGGNYSSFLDPPGKGQEEMRRLLDRGVLEGPLHYRPKVVNPQGGVWQEDKQKWRTIFDLTASGVNEALLPQVCSYDMLEDMLPKQLVGGRMFGWDLADAFFNSGRWAEHADYMGLEDTESKCFYRFRFSLFGGSDCPALQQKFATVLVKVLNKAGQGEDGWPHTTNTAAYMDDAHGVQERGLDPAVAEAEFDRMMAFMAYLGVKDSVKKRVPPTYVKSYIGFEVDALEQTVRPEPKKVVKYRQLLREVIAELISTGSVQRLKWASLVGKFQHVQPVVRGGQQLLTEAYTARDQLTEDSGAQDPWGEGCRVWVHQQALRDLEEFAILLPAAKRSYYLDGRPEENGFFRGVTLCTQEEMDKSSRAHANIPVYTTDAAGRGGGGFCGDRRHHVAFDEAECAPHKSSNFRELKQGCLSFAEFAEKEGWGSEQGDFRVLWRTDNLVSKYIVNKQGTTAPELAQLSRGLQSSCREKGVDLASAHIEGEKNVLADDISRYQWVKDASDWMVRRELFDWAEAQQGEAYTLDGAADVVGSNAMLPKFCSVVESFLRRDVRGENVWANPDFNKIEEYLVHFKRCQGEAPERTAGTFLVPVWLEKPFWRELKGGKVLAHIRPGERLFTAPDWGGGVQDRKARDPGGQGPDKVADFACAFPPCHGLQVSRRQPRSAKR